MAKKEAKTAKVKKDPVGIKVTKEFMFKLTEKEKSALGEKGAGVHANIKVTEANFKEVKSNWAAKIKDLKAQEDVISLAITEGLEKRVVDAVMVKDYELNEIKYFVSGELIESRDMTESERQAELHEQKGVKRAVKQKLAKVETAATPDEDIAKAIKEETTKKTKRSAVDGPSVN